MLLPPISLLSYNYPFFCCLKLIYYPIVHCLSGVVHPERNIFGTEKGNTFKMCPLESLFLLLTNIDKLLLFNYIILSIPPMNSYNTNFLRCSAREKDYTIDLFYLVIFFHKFLCILHKTQHNQHNNCANWECCNNTNRLQITH